MRTRRFRSALASSSTRLALAWAIAAAPAAAATEAALALRLAELETALAKRPALYLVLEPAARRLTVRARGLVLHTVELRALTLLSYRPLFGGGEPPQLAAPAVWTVEQGPGDTDRETIAPTTLRPYSEEEEMAPPTPTPVPGGTAAPPPGEREKPASYRVALDNGWQLFLVDRPPRFGWLRRFAASAKDGWLRVRGRAPAHPPLVTLVVDAEDARSLHHLFRTGTEILVAPAAP